MSHKTSTDQSFSGRRLKLGMIVLACVDGRDGNGELPDGIVIPVMVGSFVNDKPVLFSPEWQKRFSELVHVPLESDLRIGTWTFPERV